VILSIPEKLYLPRRVFEFLIRLKTIFVLALTKSSDIFTPSTRFEESGATSLDILYFSFTTGGLSGFLGVITKSLLGDLIVELASNPG
jgi:hypothetical protein